MSTTRVHALASQKGGVGKTTLAMNIAAVVYESLTRGEPVDRSPVFVASTDPQASLVWWSNRMDARGNLPFDYEQIHNPQDLGKLRELGYAHVFVDTPGSLEDEGTLEAVLDEVDDVIVPLVPEPLAFDPTTRTIRDVLEPRGIPYTVVVNNWDPRDGEADLRQTVQFILKQGWPMSRNVIRRYKVHTRASAEGRVCTQYPKSRVGQEALQDFLFLALELGYGGDPAKVGA